MIYFEYFPLPKACTWKTARHNISTDTVPVINLVLKVEKTNK